MYYDYLVNVIVVLFLCGLVIGIDLSIHRKCSPYILGVMFGLITIFVMNRKIMLAEGRFFDFRHITMTMAGFIGGPVTAAIATIISSLYRYNIGGNGVIGGITTIIVFASFGSILGRQFKKRQNGTKLWFWFIIGIVITCILLLTIAITSPWSSSLEMAIITSVVVPLVIFTPLATTIIFNFYFWTYDFFSKASILNTIINFSPIHIMVLDHQGSILRSNNLNTQPHISSYIENSFYWLDVDQEGLNTTKTQQREITTDDGKQFVAYLSSFHKPNGKDACVVIVNDVTNQLREKETLREAKERFSKAFQLGPHMMSILRTSDYRYLDVNRRFLEAGGFVREDIIGKTPIETGVPEAEFNEIIKAIEERRSVQNVECPNVTKHGLKGTVILSAEIIHLNDQECILMAYNDVTEMKRMQTEKVEQLTRYLALEADLSRNNQLIADMINHMPDGFYALDNQWRFTFVNKKAEDLFQKTREDLLGKVIWLIGPQALGTLLEINYRKARIDGIPMTFEYPSDLQKDSWHQITAYPSQSGLSVYYRDITEQKLAHENLIKSQEETVSILESMTDSFFALDGDGKLTYINHSAQEAFGKSQEELLGKKITEVFEFQENTLINYEAVMKHKKSINYEIVSEVLGNKWVEVSLYPIENGVTCYFRDISKRKKAEEEIARLDRLNLVGQLAAGIGHEIRNPMTTVRGYLQLLGAKPDYLAQKSTFELMISELDRANSIITEFLSLAQTKQTELKPQNLNDILNKLYPLLESDAFTQNKQISFIPGEVPDLKLNGNEISQLVLNLIRNGLEAMEERGSLTISTYVEEDKVVLAIEDEGCGIPLENLKKLGTPFFTTKDNGTGLGLATCYKIAECHNAKIQIMSSFSGTIFLTSFPIPEKEQQHSFLTAQFALLEA